MGGLPGIVLARSPLTCLMRGGVHWQQWKGYGGSVTINVHGVSEMTLQVRDLDEAEKWYTDNLDMPVSTRDLENGMVWLKAGEWTRIGLWLPGKREFGDRPGVHVHFALRVNKGELRGIKEQLEGKGLAVEGPVQWPEKDTPQYAEQKAKYGDN